MAENEWLQSASELVFLHGFFPFVLIGLTPSPFTAVLHRPHLLIRHVTRIILICLFAFLYFTHIG